LQDIQDGFVGGIEGRHMKIISKIILKVNYCSVFRVNIGTIIGNSEIRESIIRDSLY
jgi:hypothetical protein